MRRRLHGPLLASAGKRVVQVCSAAQVAAALVASMDTCIGEKGSDDSDDARALQQTLLAALPTHAQYPATRYLLAELQQDVALTAAQEAVVHGREATVAILPHLRPPFDALCACVNPDHKMLDVPSGAAPQPSQLQCPLTLGPGFPTTRLCSSQPLIYPVWYLAGCLLDTADVFWDPKEGFQGVFEREEMVAETHGLCLHGLQALAAAPLHKYRCGAHAVPVWRSAHTLFTSSRCVAAALQPWVG